jgi:hypothetical protein
MNCDINNVIRHLCVCTQRDVKISVIVWDIKTAVTANKAGSGEENCD